MLAPVSTFKYSCEPSGLLRVIVSEMVKYPEDDSGPSTTSPSGEMLCQRCNTRTPRHQHTIVLEVEMEHRIIDCADLRASGSCAANGGRGSGTCGGYGGCCGRCGGWHSGGYDSRCSTSSRNALRVVYTAMRPWSIGLIVVLDTHSR